MPTEYPTIVSANDVAIQTGDSGTVTTGLATLNVRSNATESLRRQLGLRFTIAVPGTIPQGSTIDSASLVTMNSHGSIDDLKCVVYCDDVDISKDFHATADSDSDPDVFGRTRTTASVSVEQLNCTIDNPQTIDVQSVIQEIVSRPDWDEATLTFLFITDGTTTYNYFAYGWGTADIPTLEVVFTAPSSDQTLLPSGIASEEAFGSVIVAPEDAPIEVQTSGIASEEAFGSPSVVTSVPPTVVQDTADETAFGNDPTPTLEFTGTDLEDDGIQYNLQISSSNVFSEVAVVSDSNTASELGSVHLNNITGGVDDRPGQSFYGSGGVIDKIDMMLGLQGAPVGNLYVKIYEHQGTFGTSSEPLNAADYLDAPTLGYIAISDAFEVSTSTLGISNAWKTITFSGSNRIVLEDGVPYVFILDYDGTGDNDDAPMCAVSASGSHAGNAYNDGNNSNNNGIVTNWEVIFELYEAPLLYDKTSGTDLGFLNIITPADTSPFNSGETVSYTIQSGEELETGTYYWRVRVKDPDGLDVYGDWSATRSFTVAITEESSILPLGISSEEAFGSATVSSDEVTILLDGIASEEAFGIPSLLADEVEILPAGIISEEAFGTPVLSTDEVTVLPSGIVSEEAFGSPTLATEEITILPEGISSEESFGSPSLDTGEVTILLEGISSAEAFGTPAISEEELIIPGGIASEEAFGEPTLSTEEAGISPVGIASEEAFGTAQISTSDATIFPSGIESEEAFGLPEIVSDEVAIVVSGIASEESFGTPELTQDAQEITPEGIPSSEAFGTPSLSSNEATIAPEGIGSAEEFGVPLLSSEGVLYPPGIPSAESFGNPVVVSDEVTIEPIGISSSEEFGTPSLLSEPVTITPWGIETEEAFGSPEIVSDSVTISPEGIPSEEQFGTPSFSGGILVIVPPGIPSEEDFGIPLVSTQGSNFGIPSSSRGRGLWNIKIGKKRKEKEDEEEAVLAAAFFFD